MHDHSALGPVSYLLSSFCLCLLKVNAPDTNLNGFSPLLSQIFFLCAWSPTGIPDQHSYASGCVPWTFTSEVAQDCSKKYIIEGKNVRISFSMMIALVCVIGLFLPYAKLDTSETLSLPHPTWHIADGFLSVLPLLFLSQLGTFSDFILSSTRNCII